MNKNLVSLCLLAVACTLSTRFAFTQALDEFYFASALNTSGIFGRSEVAKIVQDKNSGNFIVAGTYKGSIALDLSKPLTTTFSLLSVASTQSFIAMYSPSGKYLWSISLESSLPLATDSVIIKSIDLDELGNIYAVGTFNCLNLKSSAPYTLTTPKSGSLSGFYARINPYNPADLSQYLERVVAISGTKTIINDCKYVRIGNVPTLLIAGSFNGTVDLHLPSGSVANRTSPLNTYSGFITAITTNGLASASFTPFTLNGSAIGNHVEITKISVANKSRTSTEDTLVYCGNFKGGISSYTVTSYGNQDILMGRVRVTTTSSLPEGVSSVGSPQSIGSNGNDLATDIIINSMRNRITLSGTYSTSGSMDIDPSTSTINLGASSSVDAFYVQYSSNFVYLNHAKLNGTDEQHITSLGIWGKTSDTILVGGHFKVQLQYGAASINASGGYDSYMLLVKVGGTPSYIRTIHFGGASDDLLNTVFVSNYGEAVAGGLFSGNVDFDVSSSLYELSPSLPTAYILSYGDFLFPYVDSYTTGSADDELAAISIDSYGEIFAIGTYTGSINVGSFNLNSSGGTDVFIQRKHKTGLNTWVSNAARWINLGYSLENITSKINTSGDDKARSIAASDTSIYIAYIKNDTACIQRINRNTGGPVWTQKINKAGSDITAITADDQYVYFVGDSSGVHITQRINKNTGGPVWTQRIAGGKSKAITMDNTDVFTVKDSSGHTVISRINKNTGGPVWTQKIPNHSGYSIAEYGDEVYVMSDSTGSIMLTRINKNTGGPVWTQKIASGTLGNVSVNTSRGEVYISGTFTGTSSYLGLTSSGGTDGFIARINRNTGGPVWAAAVGGTGADSIKTMQATLGNDIYIGGNTQGGSFGSSSAGPGVFLVRLSVDSLENATTTQGMQTKPDEFNCQVYPNPAQNILNISAVLPNLELIQIRLVDMRGGIVFQDMHGKQTFIQKSIDVSDLAKGLYILQIQAGKHQVTRKVIKE